MASFRSNHLASKIAPFLVFLLCAVSIVALQTTQLRSHPLTLTTQPDIEREQLRLNILKQLPSFGFENLIANWTFLQYLQYFGDDEARAKTGYGLALDYLDIVLDRDPRFLDAYSFLATVGSIYTAQPQRTDAIIERGLKFVTPQVPQYSYYIWRQKGINELLFLDNVQDRARRSFQIAAEWASLYDDEESQIVAATSRQTAAFLVNNPESKTAKVGAWAMVLQNAPDRAARDRAIAEIQKLGGQVQINDEGALRVLPPTTD
jgi:hypothetical protein